jgi:hypothetical protein
LETNLLSLVLFVAFAFAPAFPAPRFERVSTTTVGVNDARGRTVDIGCFSETDAEMWLRGLQSILYEKFPQKQWSRGRFIWKLTSYQIQQVAAVRRITSTKLIVDSLEKASAEREILDYWNDT